MLGLVEQGRQAAREAADLSMRSLRLVAVATAAEYVVPALLRSFAQLHPEIHLSLEVANRATVFERVLEHEVDVAIAGRPPEDERIAGFAFLRNELALIAAPGRRACRAGAVAPRELGDRVWLQRESGSGTRQLLAEFLAEHELRPQTLTLGSNGAIKEAVRLGLGVSLAVARRGRAGARLGHARRAEGEGRPARAGVVLAPLGDGAAAAGGPALPRVRQRARRPPSVRGASRA